MARERRFLWLGLGVFVATAALVIGVNSLSYGWHWEYSISRYVGLETWSAILFALGNVAVMLAMLKYLGKFGENYIMGRINKRVFLWLVVILAATLIGLSACPLGYFDQFVGGKSVPTLVHELCSRTMFVCMALIMMFFGADRVLSDGARRWCWGFVGYGLLCALGYLMKMSWFMGWELIFETAYIVSFVLICLRLRPKTEEIAR